MDSKRNAEQGTYNGETTYCPVNGWDCPYYKKGVCSFDHPIEDCDKIETFIESWKN